MMSEQQIKRKKEPQPELLTQKLTQNRSQTKSKNWNYKISKVIKFLEENITKKLRFDKYF